jgi:hypothetical protein
MAKVTKVIDAENTFTNGLEVGMGGATIIVGDDSSFSGTLTLQVTTEDFTGYVDNITYTGEVIDIVNGSQEITVRVGCKTGEYTSGSIKVAIYRNVV